MPVEATGAVDLSIIIVSWNVQTLLAACLRSVLASLARSPALSWEVLVVDNASRDGSAEMVRRDFPQVTLFPQAENLGFVRGNNLALARSRGRYLLLLNPDAEVLGDALGQMVAYMEAHPQVGVLGPQLLNPDGSVQSSRRRFPTLATAFLESTVLHEWFPRNAVARRYHLADRPDSIEQEVDWVTGACFLVRRGASERCSTRSDAIAEPVGWFDEAIFMYSEELDWQYRLKQAGWRVVYLPSAQVIHHEGQSSGQVVAARHIYFQSSKVYFFRKHHGRAAGELLRLFLLSTYLYQWGREGAKRLLGSKRTLRAERMRAYAQVLRSGLAISWRRR